MSSYRYCNYYHILRSGFALILFILLYLQLLIISVTVVNPIVIFMGVVVSAYTWLHILLTCLHFIFSKCLNFCMASETVVVSVSPRILLRSGRTLLIVTSETHVLCATVKILDRSTDQRQSPVFSEGLIRVVWRWRKLFSEWQRSFQIKPVVPLADRSVTALW